MIRTVPRLLMTFAMTAVMALASTAAYAQGGSGSTSLSGLVVDSSGGIIPGATVVAKNNATAGEFSAVSNENGTFTIPALQPGSYKVTISLMGFKTAVLEDVRLSAMTPADIKAVLTVGGLEETVVVTGGSEIIQTQSAAVATTMDIKQISNLPLNSRSALNFIVGLPGVNTPGGSRDSTINGLPQSAINITIDGLSAMDNHLKTGDGFFARVSPRIDAMEEVTISTAAQGAESTGQGAVQIRFTTRSGSNQYTGSGYYTMRHDALNASPWFNNRDLTPDPATGKAPKTELRLHIPGARAGGPISIPGLFNGRDKAFFFFNYEEERSPSKLTRNRTLMSPQAQQGIFRYIVSGQVREVNLLQLAAANGQTSTLDPTVARLLADIRNSTTISGTLSDLTNPNRQQLALQVNTNGLTRYPTGRVDVNVTDRHRLSGSLNYTGLLSDPDTLNNVDPTFPGFPGSGVQDSKRYTVQTNLRSTLGASLVNEFKVGGSGGATLFNPGLNAGQFGTSQTVGNQEGYQIALTGGGTNALAYTNIHPGSGNSSREATTRILEDTLNWIKGSHSIQMGYAYTQADVWLKNQNHVPTITFDVVTGDAAANMFVAANFAGADATTLNEARSLYAVLTGRVSSIAGNAGLDPDAKYQYLGERLQLGRLREHDIFIADTWRVRPNLTVSAGLRYLMQLPFYARNSNYSTATMADICGVSGQQANGGCNLFQPGTLTGKKPVFTQFPEGTAAYNTDKNNFAPNLGLTWVPGPKPGILGTILGGEGDSVFKAGYSIGYNRPGMSDFTGVFGANPGILIDATRNIAQGNLNNDGRGLPLLFRDRSRVGPPPFASEPIYPMTDVITADVQIFDANIQVPYAQTWTGGWSRKVTRDIAVDIRYVGTRSLQGWTTYNFNEANIVENRFLDEFKLAQANLQANLAAGRGSTFRYFGEGTGTSPLPIYLGYFSGIPASRAGDSSLYTSTLFGNSNFTNPLARYNPNPYTPAGTNSNTGLDGDPVRRANAATAGIPVNFFRANPDLMAGGIVTGNGGYTRYDGMQLEFRKRFSQGLQFQGSYVFGNAFTTDRPSFRTPRVEIPQTGGEGGITHAYKMNWVYEFPFGQGRHFGGNVNGFVHRLIGGWSMGGTMKMQSGRMLDYGNVRLVGMTEDELVKAFKLQEYALDPEFAANARTLLYMLPKDIVQNTIRAFSTSVSNATGYGALGAPTGKYLAPVNGPDCIAIVEDFGDCTGRTELVVTGPRQVAFDLSIVKRTKIAGRVEGEFRAEALNAFNHPWFTPTIATSNNGDNYRVTAEGNGARVVQLMFRLNW